VRALSAALTAGSVPVKASAASPPAAVPLLKVTLALLLRARLPPATARVTCACAHSASSSDGKAMVSSQASTARSSYCCYSIRHCCGSNAPLYTETRTVRS
jgi:hypothetical protein